jgi:hypothetical protein
MVIILSFIVGISIGMLISKYVSKRAIAMKEKEIVDNINSNYEEVLSIVNSPETKFKSRINNIAYFSMNLSRHGIVEVIYILDKKDIAIFKDNKCIYTSDLVDKDTITSITSGLYFRFSTEINDVVSILGLTFSKEMFEKTFKIKYDDIKDQLDSMSSGSTTESEIDKIVSENEYKFNIDDILDKIGREGIQKLTTEEKQFLDNYSKK